MCVVLGENVFCEGVGNAQFDEPHLLPAERAWREAGQDEVNVVFRKREYRHCRIYTLRNDDGGAQNTRRYAMIRDPKIGWVAAVFFLDDVVLTSC